MCLYSWDYTINHNENEGEKRPHRYDINKPRCRRGHEYSKYKKCLSMMMLICMKQHISVVCKKACTLKFLIVGGGGGAWG